MRWEPPIDIDREAAAEEARRELAKAEYSETGDSLITRAMEWLLEQFAKALGEVALRSPGGYTGLFILLGVIALLVIVIFWRAGVVRGARALRASVFDDEPVRRAAEYRAEAEAHASAGRFGPAVRSRFRACVAELTERTILDDRAGRTAYEVVNDASTAIPALGGPLRPAAHAFVEVVYGDRPGTPQRYATVVAADEAARKTSTRSMVSA